MTRVFLAAAMVLMAALALGCKKGDGLDCKHIAAKITEIARIEAKQFPADEQKALEASLAAIESEAHDECKKSSDKYQAMQPCILAAKTSAELSLCFGKDAPPASKP